MILTSEQIDSLEKIWQTWYVDIPLEQRGKPIKIGGAVLSPATTEEISDEDIADTLVAYADIVQRVAEKSQTGMPYLANGIPCVQLPEDIYLAARKLRGLE